MDVFRKQFHHIDEVLLLKKTKVKVLQSTEMFHYLPHTIFTMI